MGLTIPDKMYFKIGEVARMAGVRTSVLRFWETEFEFLKPEKSSAGQRLYTRNELELILQVRSLLYEDKFTIEGVKKKISPKGKTTFEKSSPLPSGDHIRLLKDIKEELRLLRNEL